MTGTMIVKAEGQEITLERVFDAPRELVFKAFSTAEHLQNWWGPRGWELSANKLDFRPGGAWHYCMKCEDKNQGDFYGFESWGKAIYTEIVAPEKIVYTDYFSDAEGNEVQGMPSSEVTMLFLEQDGKTKLISKSRYSTAEEVQKVMEMGMEQGVTETWDRLAEHLQAQQQ